jgi:hypothetical protein
MAAQGKGRPKRDSAAATGEARGTRPAEGVASLVAKAGRLLRAGHDHLDFYHQGDHYPWQEDLAMPYHRLILRRCASRPIPAGVFVLWPKWQDAKAREWPAPSPRLAASYVRVTTTLIFITRVITIRGRSILRCFLIA